MKVSIFNLIYTFRRGLDQSVGINYCILLLGLDKRENIQIFVATLYFKIFILYECIKSNPIIYAGVIVLGATNRESDLDKAILRPGRFDTKVEVGIPDLKGRSEILELYLAKVKHDSSINVEILAKKTNGMSGAELSNLVNTATIKAAVDNKARV